MSKPIRCYQLYHLFAAHFKEVIRQPAVIFWGIIFPILISLGLGMAFTQKGGMVHRVGVMPGGPDLPARMTVQNSKLGDTTFVFTETDWKNAVVLLKRGKISLLLDSTEGGRIRYHFDPRNPDGELAYLKLSRVLGGGSAQNTEPAGQIVPLTVSGTRYIDFLVPGLIAMGVMMSCMWGISYGMIEKRSKKLLRRMVATPMRKSHFLMALMAVRIVMNLIEAGLLFVFAWLVFGIVVQGSLSALAVLFLTGNIAFGGLAIFVSSRTANTEVGNGLINAVVLPMTVLSGIFFSYHNFPEWSIPLIRKLPLALFTDGIRSIFNEGAGFAETGAAAAALAAAGIIFFCAGLRVFRWH